MCVCVCVMVIDINDDYATCILVDCLAVTNMSGGLGGGNSVYSAVQGWKVDSMQSFDCVCVYVLWVCCV